MAIVRDLYPMGTDQLMGRTVPECPILLWRLICWGPVCLSFKSFTLFTVLFHYSSGASHCGWKCINWSEASEQNRRYCARFLILNLAKGLQLDAEYFRAQVLLRDTEIVAVSLSPPKKDPRNMLSWLLPSNLMNIEIISLRNSNRA